MKKRGIILLLILAFCLAFVSCKEASQDSSEESKSVYELAVEAGFEGTLEEWCEAVANTKQNESKSVYELAVEAGFEGTLEEWCEAVSDIKDTSDGERQNNISLSDAILIAQTHYFAVYFREENAYSDMPVVAQFYVEDSESWHIIISPTDVKDDDELLIYKGQAYLYTISKETGEIIEIDASGE